MGKKIVFDDFIERSDIIHSDQFQYILSGFDTIFPKKAEIVCPVHGHFFQTILSHLSGRKCRKCKYEKHGKLLSNSLDKFLAEATKIHGDKYDYSMISTYTGNKVKLPIVCKTHGVFYASYNKHVSHKKGCPKCGIQKSIDFSFSSRKSHDKFLMDVIKVHGENRYEYISNYESAWKKIDIKCLRCEKIFSQAPANHLFGQGCPFCNESKGEKEIAKILDSLGVKYERQKWFPDCRGIKRPLPFDFYIEEKNSIIEFDGEQHFAPKNFKGAMKESDVLAAHKKTQKHDKIKNDYCLLKNIRLLRVSYKEINKVEDLIKDFLAVEIHNVNSRQNTK